MISLRTEIARRLTALVVAGAAFGLLLVAVLIAPSGDGHGTHTQLGLPSCGWVVAFDTPCPTCGMTTSYSHAVRGDLLGALRTQPMGSLLAMLTASVVVAGLHVAITGCVLGRFVNRLLTGRTLWIALGLTLAAWVYKILSWS